MDSNENLNLNHFPHDEIYQICSYRVHAEDGKFTRFTILLLHMKRNIFLKVSSRASRSGSVEITAWPAIFLEADRIWYSDGWEAELLG